MQSRFLRVSILPALLAAPLLTCSRFAAAPTVSFTVLYANDATTINGAPGTATITWLTPGTATGGQSAVVPCASDGGCNFVWFPSGFRTDVVQPFEHKCVHFEAPDSRIAPEVKWSYPDGSGGAHFAGNPDVTWHTETDWSFDGYNIGPASTGC